MSTSTAAGLLAFHAPRHCTYLSKNTHNCKLHSRQFYTSSTLMSSPSPSNWELITNHQTSKTVKLFKQIHRANKSKRSDLGVTVAEGVRLVSDILANANSRSLVRRIIISESFLSGGDADQYQQQLLNRLEMVEEESRQKKAEQKSNTCAINIGTEKVVEACSGTVTSQGVVALMDIPAYHNPLESASSADASSADDSDGMPPFYLILDGLADPGNVGTLLRSCLASHVTALILLPGSCDVWNPKAVRSAMGASFQVPVLEMSGSANEGEALNEVLDMLDKCGVPNDRIYAATMEDSGDNASLPHFDIDFGNGGGSAVILGREGEGLRSNVRSAIEQGIISTVHVPMAPGMESLNAAVCGSVIMFERMRQLLMSKKE